MVCPEDFRVTLEEAPGSFAGQIQVDDVHDGYLFFWYFPATKPSTDMVLWLNGGPGVSSMDGVLLEIGPLRMQMDGSTKANPHTWNDRTDLLFVDQPFGTGYSYGNVLMNSTQLAMKAMGVFMTKFYSIFNHTTNHNLYLSGESYAGMYLPYLAQLMLSNKQNVKGIFVGSPWIDPAVQYGSYIDYALKYGLITQDQVPQLRKTEQLCLPQVKGITEAKCEGIVPEIQRLDKQRRFASDYANVYSISVRGSQSGMDWPPEVVGMAKYLNREDVQAKLNVLHFDGQWVEGVEPAFKAMAQDPTPPSIDLLPELVKQMEVVIFAARDDFLCNYIGLERSLRGRFQLQKTPLQSWKYGTGFQSGNLTFVTVDQGSHMLSYDKPLIASEMFDMTLQNNWTFTKLKPSQQPPVQTDTEEFSGLQSFVSLTLLVAVVGFIVYYVNKRRRHRHYQPANANRDESFEMLDVPSSTDDEDKLISVRVHSRNE